jgi:hypothetical protein
MLIKQITFAAVSIAAIACVIAYLHGHWAKLAMTVIVIAVMYFGPSVFGRDWYYGGFVAGLALGLLACRFETEEKKQGSGDARSAARLSERPPTFKVIMTLDYLQVWRQLSLGDEEQTAVEKEVEIENPSVIPMVGDKVSFADRYDWTVVQREIDYRGLSEPDGRCLITVYLRERADWPPAFNVATSN